MERNSINKQRRNRRNYIEGEGAVFVRDKLLIKMQKEGRFICGNGSKKFPCNGKRCQFWKDCIQPQRVPPAKEQVEFT
jgi:hypothetical protein